MEQKERIFCGSGKQPLDWKIAINVCLTDIPKEHIFTSEKTGKKYIKLDVCERKNGADQYGNTHSVEVNTWKPDKNKAPASKFDDEEDIPF